MFGVKGGVLMFHPISALCFIQHVFKSLIYNSFIFNVGMKGGGSGR